MVNGRWSRPQPADSAGPRRGDELLNVGHIVQALDAKSGDLIWEHSLGPASTTALRNMAIYEDKLFLATNDARLIALNARNGQLAWDTRIADGARGYLNSSGPMVVRGTVVQGLGGCDEYNDAGCYISAYEAATGKPIWKFYTVAREGTPGGNTWGTLPNMFRAGGETWITGSYDPDLDLMYWGVAQPKPSFPISRGMTVFDKALYTSSTLALRPKDGTLAWFFQHVPGEALDLDEVFERVLVDIGTQKFVFSAGKSGILWKHDRQSGQFAGLTPMVFQNVFDTIDPKTGAVTYRNDIVEARIDRWVGACPSTEGGKNWPPMSYHKASNLLIIPLSQSCMEMAGRKVELKKAPAARPPAASSTRCRVPTATSASSPPTTRPRSKKMELSAAGAVPHWRPLDGRWPGVRRRSGSLLPSP